MPFVEVESRQPSMRNIDDVILKINEFAPQKPGGTSKMAELVIGSNVARAAGLQHAEYAQLSKGTGTDAGRVMVTPATMGRKLKRTNKSGWASCKVTLPLRQLEKAHLTKGHYKLFFQPMPDGALVVHLPD